MEPIGRERNIIGMTCYPYDVPREGAWNDPWNDGNMRRPVGHPTTGHPMRVMSSHTISDGMPCCPMNVPKDDPWDELPQGGHPMGRPVDRPMACLVACNSSYTTSRCPTGSMCYHGTSHGSSHGASMG